jgi:hypothetical protein
MATNAAEAAQDAATNAEQEADAARTDGGQEQEGGEQKAAPSVEEIARELGWTPPNQFRGDPEAFKDAETFLRDGRDIQRGYKREIENLRSTMENIQRTTGSIVEQEVNRRVEELSGRYQKAVEDGDAPGAFKLSREIDSVLASVPTNRPAAPSSESQAFADRNKWFKVSPTAPGDALATATAIDVCNRLAGQGYDSATQLDAAEKEVRRQFPHLFGQNGKPQAGVNSPSSRGPSLKSGLKAYADMPDAARKVADDMVARGVIPDKESYAKNYWLNSEGKA